MKVSKMPWLIDCFSYEMSEGDKAALGFESGRVTDATLSAALVSIALRHVLHEGHQLCEEEVAKVIFSSSELELVSLDEPNIKTFKIIYQIEPTTTHEQPFDVCSLNGGIRGVMFKKQKKVHKIKK